MANSTFSGPVRSENGFKTITKTASTGVVHDRTYGIPAKDARRYYLEENFLQRPGINGDIDAVSTTEVQRALNRNVLHPLQAYQKFYHALHLLMQFYL